MFHPICILSCSCIKNLYGTNKKLFWVQEEKHFLLYIFWFYEHHIRLVACSSVLMLLTGLFISSQFWFCETLWETWQFVYLFPKSYFFLLIARHYVYMRHAGLKTFIIIILVLVIQNFQLNVCDKIIWTFMLLFSHFFFT